MKGRFGIAAAERPQGTEAALLPRQATRELAAISSAVSVLLLSAPARAENDEQVGCRGAMSFGRGCRSPELRVAVGRVSRGATAMSLLISFREAMCDVATLLQLTRKKRGAHVLTGRIRAAVVALMSDDYRNGSLLLLSLSPSRLRRDDEAQNLTRRTESVSAGLRAAISSPRQPSCHACCGFDLGVFSRSLCHLPSLVAKVHSRVLSFCVCFRVLLQVAHCLLVVPYGTSPRMAREDGPCWTSGHGWPAA